MVEGSGRNFVEGLNSDDWLSFGRFGSFGLQDVLCGFGTWRGRFFLISREDAEPPSFAKKTLDSACCASRVGSLGGVGLGSGAGLQEFGEDPGVVFGSGVVWAVDSVVY